MLEIVALPERQLHADTLLDPSSLTGVEARRRLLPGRPVRRQDVQPRVPRGGKFPVKYYLTAMMFILFDVETAFFYPWALVFQLPEYAAYALGAMAGFFFVLAVGFVYE